MTDIQKISLQKWWMEQIREVTRKVMAQEEKRKARELKKGAAVLGDLEIESMEDIDELYGYGVISARKRDRLIELLEKAHAPDEMYDAKIKLLQDEYAESQRILRELVVEE